MIKPTPEQHDALERLRGAPIHAYIKAALCRCRDSLEKQTDPRSLAYLQGEANVLRTFVELIDPTGKQA